MNGARTECDSPHYHMICGDEDDMTDMIFSKWQNIKLTFVTYYFNHIKPESIFCRIMLKKKVRVKKKPGVNQKKTEIFVFFFRLASPGAPKGKRAGSYAINVTSLCTTNWDGLTYEEGILTSTKPKKKKRPLKPVAGCLGSRGLTTGLARAELAREEALELELR